MSKIAIVALLASLAVAHGASFVSSHNSKAEDMQKEGRIIEVPIIGSLIFKGAKIGFLLLKSAWSLVGLKLGAIALVANLVIWGLKHSFSIILGGVAMFGFCKLTGKCSLELVPKPVFDIGETLLYAARQLENGAALYDDDTARY